MLRSSHLSSGEICGAHIRYAVNPSIFIDGLYNLMCLRLNGLLGVILDRLVKVFVVYVHQVRLVIVFEQGACDLPVDRLLLLICAALVRKGLWTRICLLRWKYKHPAVVLCNYALSTTQTDTSSL